MGKGGSSKDVPKNWPQDIIYLTAPVYSPRLTKAQLQAIRQRPAAANAAEEIPTLPPDFKRGPSPLVKITRISDPVHPAHGQFGLFAARDLRPGTLIVPYLGEVHPGATTTTTTTAAATATAAGGDSSPQEDHHAKSDYDLWLDHDADVAVDAARMGNEARFVNDYRGVPGRSKPNAEFREIWWDGGRPGAGGGTGGERGMAFFVLPAGKKQLHKQQQQGGASKNAGMIAKGEEIVVSYGKGFWGKRKEEWGEEAGEDEA